MNKQVVTLTVEGMSCDHCVNRIKKVVSALKGVSGMVVYLKGNTVSVEYDEKQVKLDAIKTAIEDQGYEVK